MVSFKESPCICHHGQNGVPSRGRDQQTTNIKQRQQQNKKSGDGVHNGAVQKMRESHASSHTANDQKLFIKRDLILL